MQITKSLLALALGVMVLTGSAALAGQFAEFEEQMRAAYAPTSPPIAMPCSKPTRKTRRQASTR